MNAEQIVINAIIEANEGQVNNYSTSKDMAADYGFDSLDIAHICICIEDVTGVAIRLDQIDGKPTVAKFVSLIEGKI